MEHCRNSTGLIFRRFAIYYRIFLAILLIFDACFARYPACPAFLAIISPQLYATCGMYLCRIIVLFAPIGSHVQYRCKSFNYTRP